MASGDKNKDAQKAEKRERKEKKEKKTKSKQEQSATAFALLADEKNVDSALSSLFAVKVWRNMIRYSCWKLLTDQCSNLL